MDPRNFKIIVPTIFIVLLLSAHAVTGAQVCVDCDLDKNIKIINTKVVEDKILYNDVRKVKNDTEQYCFVKIVTKEKDGVVSKEEELYCSYDPYQYIRDSYIQNRDYKVNDGIIDDELEDELFDLEDF